jgi:hypothetical protein
LPEERRLKKTVGAALFFSLKLARGNEVTAGEF